MVSTEPTCGDWTLPAVDASAALARRLLSEQLSEVHPDLRDVILLLTSELVTNAVRHGAAPITMHLTSSARGVQVEVDDSGPRQPVVRPFDPEAIDGRGLRLVGDLATSWGVDRHAAGKTVWFRQTWV